MPSSQIWSWYGAGDGYATMLPVRNEDIFNGTFTADGSPKTWTTRPFYNVTNVIAAVDVEKSKKDEAGIAVPKFARDAVPKSAQVFKDPLLLKKNIFLNDAAHAELKALLEKAALKGSSFRPV